MGSILRSDLERLQKSLNQLDRIFRLLPQVDFQMVSALVSESCGDDDKGLMSRLAEMFMVDGYNQRKPVRVVAYEESETLQLYVDEANMTIKQCLERIPNGEETKIEVEPSFDLLPPLDDLVGVGGVIPDFQDDEDSFLAVRKGRKRKSATATTPSTTKKRRQQENSGDLLADVKVELNEGNSICDDYGVGDIEEENDPYGDDGDYEPVMKKRGRKPKKKFGPKSEYIPQEESGHRAKEESTRSKERIPVKEEGDLPDDFIFEDEANTDDLWSEEARLKYGTKPKPGEEDEWNKWVMGGLTAEPNRSDKWFATKRRRLRELISWICEVFNSPSPIPSDFHPLRNKLPEFYGLSDKAMAQWRGSWKQELTFILMACPLPLGNPGQPYDKETALAQLFEIAASTTKKFQNVYSNLFNGRMGKVGQIGCDSHRRFESTAVTREVLTYGFRPFATNPSNIFGGGPLGFKSEPQLDESTGALLEGEAPNPDSFKMAEPKNRKRNRGLHCMTNDKINMTCVEWMSRNRNSTITIDKVERPYSSLVLWTHRLHVIQDILLKQGFAVLGLHVPPDPGKTDEDTVETGSQVVKGKVLMEFHRSTTFSASRDVHNLISLLEQNLGMSKSSMYNRSEFDQTKTWKQTRGVDFYAKRQFMRLPEAERNEKCAEYSRIHENLESAGQRVTITNLQESEDPVKVELSDTFDTSLINNVAFVRRDATTDSLILKELITEDYIVKCKANAPKDRGNKPGRMHTFNDKKCCDYMLELLIYFQQCEVKDLYPHISHEVDACNESFRNMKLVQYAEAPPPLKMCPHCGLKEDQFIVDFTEHKFKCSLEHQSCDCEVTFSTPKDKRRHMLLVHSGKNYLTCPHCPMILLSKTAMEKHIEEYHGSSDLRQQICDLCFHQFKSANNLRIHRFNHENYFCSACCIEIKGRNAHKAHMMKEHAVGFPCNMCDKVIYTEKELEAHKKEAHSRVWKT